MTRHEGDNHLSSQDRQLWSLTYSTLEKFGCSTIFKDYRGSVPHKIDHHIWFMVPADHSRAAEVKEYLEHEAKRFIFLERQREDDWFPNTHVHVEYFSGVHPYLERDESEIMAEEAAKQFVAKLGCRKDG